MISNSKSTSSSLASSTGLNSVYLVSLPGWYNDNSFCKFCICLGTTKAPSWNTICCKVTSPFWSSTKGEAWFVANLIVFCTPVIGSKYIKGYLCVCLDGKV